MAQQIRPRGPDRSVPRYSPNRFAFHRRAHARGSEPGQLESQASEAPPSTRRRRLVDVISVFSALFGIVAAFVSVIDVADSLKALWLGAMATLAFMMALVVLKDPDVAGQSRGQRTWRGVLRRLAMPVAALIILTVAVVGQRNIQTRLTEASIACVLLAAGNEGYARAFDDAYDRNGGKERLGCAYNSIEPWEQGVHQMLRGPEGDSAIMALDPREAHVLVGEAWVAYQSLGRPGFAPREVGYPVTDQLRTRRGWKIELRGGAAGSSALIRQEEGRWFLVRGELWTRYSDELGGPDGTLGYPTADAGPWNSGIRQEFEHGWLFYRQDVGVLTGEEYVTRDDLSVIGPAMSVEAPEIALVYNVEAGGGGIPHEIVPGGYVEQAFVSPMKYVDQLGVLVGWNAETTTGRKFELELQLVEQGGDVLASRRAALNNNQITAVQFDPPIEVLPDRPYLFRVINKSNDVVGVYVNDPTRTGHIADLSARAHYVGELVRPEPYYDQEFALCGRVRARSSI